MSLWCSRIKDVSLLDLFPLNVKHQPLHTTFKRAAAQTRRIHKDNGTQRVDIQANMRVYICPQTSVLPPLISYLLILLISQCHSLFLIFLHFTPLISSFVISTCPFSLHCFLLPFDYPLHGHYGVTCHTAHVKRRCTHSDMRVTYVPIHLNNFIRSSYAFILNLCI